MRRPKQFYSIVVPSQFKEHSRDICMGIRPIHNKLLMESQNHDHTKMFHFDFKTKVRKDIFLKYHSFSGLYGNHLFYKAEYTSPGTKHLAPGSSDAGCRHLAHHEKPCNLKRTMKKHFRNAFFRSLAHSRQKLWPKPDSDNLAPCILATGPSERSDN